MGLLVPRPPSLFAEEREERMRESVGVREGES